MDAVTIEPLLPSRVDETARMLARSFDDDPIFQYLFPKGPARLHINTTLFRATLLDALAFDNVFVAVSGREVIGASTWLPPPGYPITPRRQVAFVAKSISVIPRAPTRLLVSLRYLRASDRAHPKEMHWYLALLGVEPDHQGEGIGARLVDHTLERLDREGLPAYLETNQESNLAWYARRRFARRETLRPQPSGPPMWTMWRDPT